MDQGVSPAYAREVLGEHAIQMEQILLGIRLAEGLDASLISPDHRPLLAEWVSRGLLDGAALLAGRVVPTLQGRLVADFMARELT